MKRSSVCAAVLATAVLAACLHRAPPPPSVLLITVDSVRPDFLSCYGGRHLPTPHIDAVAKEGVLFTQAVCDVPWTRASLASMMTGQYATHHGVRTLYQRLPDGAATMAGAFRAAGYRTAAVVASFDLDHIFQLDQGFERYDDRFEAPIAGGEKHPLHLASIFYGTLEDDRRFRRWKLHSDSMRTDAQTSDAAIAWLRRTTDQPFFLWVHYFGAHEVWTANGEVSDMVRQYEGGVRRVDEEVGRLLQALAAVHRDRTTLVVLHADHGQGLLEHGVFGHGTDLYDESVHVPLVMRWPEHLPSGGRIDELVSLVDVFPTIADLVGIPVPQGLDGRSVAPALRGVTAPFAAETYAETLLSATMVAGRNTTGPDGEPLRVGFRRRSVRIGSWKYIRNEPVNLIDLPPLPELPQETRRAFSSEELYDLEHDPYERTNVIDRETSTAAALRAKLPLSAGRSDR